MASGASAERPDGIENRTDMNGGLRRRSDREYMKDRSTRVRVFDASHRQSSNNSASFVAYKCGSRLLNNEKSSRSIFNLKGCIWEEVVEKIKHIPGRKMRVFEEGNRQSKFTLVQNGL